MYKILMVLIGLVAVTNPLTAQFIQPEVIRGLELAVVQFNNGWDWIVAEGGWIVTGVFGAYVCLMAGYVVAKQQLKDKRTTDKNIAKAKASNKRNTDGMLYIKTKKKHATA